jgi:hypothetical protein
MTIRFFIGLLFTAVVLTAAAWICGLSVHPVIFFDVPSIVLAILFPLVFQGILHGWKDVASAFSAPFHDAIDKNALLKAKLFFKNYCTTLFSTAFIGFMLSFMAMMVNLENKEALGPTMMVASLVLLYAGIINMTIITPYKILINKKLLAEES